MKKGLITPKIQSIIELINNDYTTGEIVKITGYIPALISWTRKKYNLQKSSNARNNINVLDWNKLQEYYNKGFSRKETALKYNISLGTISYGVSKGLLKTRTPKEALINERQRFPKGRIIKLSDSAKHKIRICRIKYMQEHPKQTAWFRRSSHMLSFPEILFMNELNKRKISGWCYDYNNGINKYDFAFPKIKLDVEIDGGWHNSFIQKEKDILRDKFSIDNGWKIIRFPAKTVLNNVNKCVDLVVKNLNNTVP